MPQKTPPASSLKDMYRLLQEDHFPDTVRLTLGDTELRFAKRRWTIDGQEKGLRYGENPDQPAALYELAQGRLELDGVVFRGPGQGLVSSLREEHMLQAGKHPGKTNFTDVDNGINILQYLHARPAALVLKHNNPSGAAWSQEGIASALEKAYMADRIAAFGGAVVLNRAMDKAAAERIGSAYFEVVAAPEFEPGVLEMLKRRKNLRILRIPGLGRLEEWAGTPYLDIKSLTDGGLILQQSFVSRIRTPEDFLPASAEKDGVTVCARTPTPQEAEDLAFAWSVEAGVTSNSVIFAKDGATVAIGTGEQDRVGCVELAVHKAYTKYADLECFQRTGMSIYELEQKANADTASAALLAEIRERTAAARAGLPGSVLVSDGFFPFRDGVDRAIAQGVTAIAQPGGSLRDHEVIAAVNEAAPQVAMVFTGQRSFKH